MLLTAALGLVLQDLLAVEEIPNQLTQQQLLNNLSAQGYALIHPLSSWS